MSETYLAVSVDRIAAMLKQVGAEFTPRLTRVLKHVDPAAPVPCWWLFPGVMQPGAYDDEDTDIVTYTVTARLIVGDVTTGYDGVLAEKLWTWIPTICAYFAARRELVYTADQEPPLGLVPDGVRVRVATPYGLFANSNFVGLDLEFSVPFVVETPQEY